MPVIAASLALAGVLGGGPVPERATAAAPAATFDPSAFFTGRTESRGTLKQMLSSTKQTRVTTFGTMKAGRVLTLDQKVWIGDDPVKNRTWELREPEPGRIEGSISDATSPVKGTVKGAVMTLAYKLEGGLSVSQTVTLQPGGQSARNVMKIRKLGIVVATLEETITRKPR